MEETIKIPEGVDVNIDSRTIRVRGKKAEISRNFGNPMFIKSVTFEKKDGKIIVKTSDERKKNMAMAGTVKAHLRNMFTGVTDGYSYRMKILYTHFPISAAVKGGVVEVKNFLGEKGIRKSRIVGDVSIKVDKEEITITGADIEHVSQTAANIESACRLSKRDRRIFQDGIYITSKGD